MNKQNTLLKVIALISYIFMIGVNALANILPIGGINTGQVANLYPNLFTPANYTFSIWGLIYLILGIFIYKLFKFNDTNEDKVRVINTITIGFIISSILNASWIYYFHMQEIFVSLVIMILLLICLAFMNVTAKSELFSNDERMWFRPTLSIYFGWITVATIANIVIHLVDIGWDKIGIGNELWLCIVLLLGHIITVSTMYRLKCPGYIFPVIWAYIGILIKHLTDYQGDYTLAISTLVISLILMLLSTGHLIRKIFKEMNENA